MGCICGKLRDSLNRFVQPGQHAVQRLRQTLQFIAGSRYGKLSAEIMDADGLRCSSNPVHRLQRSSADPVATHSRQSQQAGYEPAQQTAELVKVSGEFLNRFGGLYDPYASSYRHPDRGKTNWLSRHFEDLEYRFPPELGK